MTRRFPAVPVAVSLGGVRRGVGTLGVALLLGLLSAPLAAQQSHLLVVAGLGGGDSYTEAFTSWALTLRQAAVERYGVPVDNVTVLGEDPAAEPGVTGESRREDVTAALGRLARSAGPGDRVLVVFIGHGSTRDGEARINLPGPDLTAAELAPLLDAISVEHLAVVNTASASGPWVGTLARPGRTVVTATRTAGERNETRFGEYFAAAWSDEGADLDKDGRVSLLEAFTFASRETDRFYSEANRLKTEHAVLDDDGDGEGTETPSTDLPDGALAARFTLGRAGVTGVASTPDETPSGGVPASAAGDSVLVRLYEERRELEEAVADLRGRRSELDPEVYDARLEELLVEVALKNREIRLREGGGP